MTLHSEKKHLQHQLFLSEHRVAAVRGQQHRAVLPIRAAAAGGPAAMTKDNWGTATRLMLQWGCCSQATSCAQAQHNAHTSHVAQGTEGQGVNDGEA